MAGSFNLRALITAVDRLSPTLRRMSQNLNGFKRQMQAVGKGGVAMGAGLAAGLLLPAKAFVEAENAATQLQNTLMGADGLSAGFTDLHKIAIDLGNKLPGTTADFEAMASVLKSLGVSTDVLTGGALKATAYLAVVGKPLGVTYETAANAMGKLANAFGTTGAELIPFADSIQRTLHMGADLEQMGYAMARIAGPLKAMGKQGLTVANEVVPLVALLTKMGISGEEAGTGIGKFINVFVMKGKFKGIPEMVHSLEAMNKLEPSKKLQQFKALFGALHAPKAMIIAAGGYDDMIKKMAAQASLQQRINNSLGTLGNLWEAATGTFTNAMVAFAEAYAPQLKELTVWINEMSVKLLEWSENNGPAIRTAIKMAGALVGVKLAALGIAAGIGLITAAMRMNPLMLLVQGVAFAAPLIAEHWDGIMERLTKGWERFIAFLQPGIDTIKYMFGFFKDIKLPDFNMSLPSGPGMRPPGSKPLIRSGGNRVTGALDVNFNNAPAGMRVAPVANNGGVMLNPNVGYRSFMTGMP